jgi:hypothetical protein
MDNCERRVHLSFLLTAVWCAICRGAPVIGAVWCIVCSACSGVSPNNIDLAAHVGPSSTPPTTDGGAVDSADSAAMVDGGPLDAPQAQGLDGAPDAIDGPSDGPSDGCSAPESAVCATDGAALCGDTTADTTLCGLEANAPGSYLVNYGTPPGVCVYAMHTAPLVRPTPPACCAAYGCDCLQQQDVCDIPDAPHGPIYTWEGCAMQDGVAVVTCQ